MSSKLSKNYLNKSVKAHAEINGFDIVSLESKNEVSDVLLDAFINDPIPEYVTGIKDVQDPVKEKYKKLMMKYIFDWMNIDVLKQKNGIAMGVKENGSLVGVVTLVASACDKTEGFLTTLRKGFQFGIPPTESSLGKEHFHPLASKRLTHLEGITKRRLQILKERGHDKYIYIQQIGVKTTHQGQGIGGKLLRAIFDVAAAGNAVCYLETETKENESLYQHLGFQTVEEMDISVPGDDTILTMYFMLRS